MTVTYCSDLGSPRAFRIQPISLSPVNSSVAQLPHRPPLLPPPGLNVVPRRPVSCPPFRSLAPPSRTTSQRGCQGSSVCRVFMPSFSASCPLLCQDKSLSHFMPLLLCCPSAQSLLHILLLLLSPQTLIYQEAGPGFLVYSSLCWAGSLLS